MSLGDRHSIGTEVNPCVPLKKRYYLVDAVCLNSRIDEFGDKFLSKVLYLSYKTSGLLIRQMGRTLKKNFLAPTFSALERAASKSYGDCYQISQ